MATCSIGNLCSAFLKGRKRLKVDNSDSNIVAYKALRKKILPYLLKQKEGIVDKIKKLQIQNIKMYGFIKADSKEVCTTGSQLERDLRAIELYLQY